MVEVTSVCSFLAMDEDTNMPEVAHFLVHHIDDALATNLISVFVGVGRQIHLQRLLRRRDVVPQLAKTMIGDRIAFVESAAALDAHLVPQENSIAHEKLSTIRRICCRAWYVMK